MTAQKYLLLDNFYKEDSICIYNIYIYIYDSTYASMNIYIVMIHCWLPAKVMYPANSTERFSRLTRSTSILSMKNIQIYCIDII